MTSSKLSIIYVTNARIPTERAQGIQIVNTCASLASAGVDVELIVPWRYNSLKADPYEYYNVPKNFKIKKLFTLDLVWFGSVGFIVQEWTFAFSAKLYLLFTKKLSKTDRKNILYIRGERILSVLKSFTKNHSVFLESHMMPKDMKEVESIFRLAKGIVVITKYYEKQLQDMKFNVLYAPDGVTISNFDIAVSQQEAREQLGLPFNKKIVMYTGHLYSWKGTDVLADAAKFLKDSTEIIFVGGSPEDLEPFKKRHADAKNIVMKGIRPHKEIPLYLKASDVVVLPNTEKEDVSKWYTSPVKLFEYMASGRPIVSSDLPSMRDVLNESNASMVTPDNPQKLAEKITELLENHQKSKALAEKARKDVEAYSWNKRAQRIIDFITSFES